MGNVQSADFTSLLAVEFMAGNTAKSVRADQLIPSILGLLEVGNLGEFCFFEFIDFAEKLHQMAHIRFAKLRHGGIEIFPLAFSVEQDFGDPFWFELRTHMRERGREAALIAQRWLGAGEEWIAFR